MKGACHSSGGRLFCGDFLYSHFHRFPHFEEFFDAHGQVRFVYYHDCNGRDGCNRKLPKSTLMLVVIRIVILYTTYE